MLPSRLTGLLQIPSLLAVALVSVQAIAADSAPQDPSPPPPKSSDCSFAPASKFGNWPAWRGPQGTGVSASSPLPLRWSKTENVRWRVSLPEPGNSTPVVWCGRVYVSQPLAKQGKRSLFCFSRYNGKLLWQADVPHADPEPTHETNPYCSSSPVTDGARVIVWHGSAGLYCYDPDGKSLWSVDLGKQTHEWGYGSSPILHKDLCILQFGPGPRSFLVALRKTDGREVWRVNLPQPGDDPQAEAGVGPDGKSQGGIFHGSWSTPLIIQHDGQDQFIVNEPGRLAAYDPASGRPLWRMRGLGSLVYASPLWGDGVLVALGGYHSGSLAAKPGGEGDVSATHRLWHSPRSKLRLGSGIIRDGRLFIGDMQNIVQCQDLATGKVLWEERLSAAAGKNDCWSSMVENQGRIYLMNQSGDTFVFKAGPKFELLATNSLDEPTNSSPAPSGADLFLRTHQALWCISAPASPAAQ